MKHIYLIGLLLVSISACQDSSSRQVQQSDRKADTLFYLKARLATMDLVKDLGEAFDEREHKLVLPPQLPPVEDIYADSLNCALYGAPSPALRSQHYPFNQAKAVKLISYKAFSYLDTAVHDQSHHYLLLYQGKLNLRETKQTVSLREAQIDSLAHLLYNFQYKGATFTYSEAKCLFTARNAIIFYNSEDKPFAYMEICFSCEQFLVFPKWFQTGEFCNQKFTLLAAFFRQVGISSGIGPE